MTKDNIKKMNRFFDLECEIMEALDKAEVEINDVQKEAIEDIFTELYDLYEHSILRQEDKQLHYIKELRCMKLMEGRYGKK